MSEWKSVEQNIIKKCKAHRKSQKYIDEYLFHAEKLHSNGLPLIMSPYHLSLLLGLDYHYLCSMAYASERFYRHFSIPKKNGQGRSIDEPLPDLKNVQRWILKNILEHYPVSRYAKAFISGGNVKANAKYHRGQSVVIAMDIKDFFPSIKIKDVFQIFCDMGYSKRVSNFLAHLCCLNYSLPQGAPTSPYLSNLKMLKFDKNLSEYIILRKLRYTRYADDITISGDCYPSEVIRFVSDELYKNGLRHNKNKTRVAHQYTRQEVTGIVVNKKLNVSRDYRKRIRQEFYYINKYGLDSHLLQIHETRTHYKEHLLGKINYALFINPNDQEMLRYFEQIKL